MFIVELENRDLCGFIVVCCNETNTLGFLVLLDGLHRCCIASKTIRNVTIEIPHKFRPHANAMRNSIQERFYILLQGQASLASPMCHSLQLRFDDGFHQKTQIFVDTFFQGSSKIIRSFFITDEHFFHKQFNAK